MIEQKILPSKNNQPLQFTLFSPEPIKKKIGIIISPAMAVKQRYYKSFASHLSSLGYYVITFDNLGVGEKYNDLSYYDWAIYDLTLMIDWVYNNISSKIILIGHSAGGQLLGLSPSCLKLTKVFLISSGTGYWKFWPFPRKIFLFSMWYFLFPFFLKLYGYSPKWAMGEKLPKGIISEWLQWGRKKNFMLDIPEIAEKNYFDKIRVEIIGINFRDDTYAPFKAAEKLISFYTNGKVDFKSYNPKSLGFKKIGHFGFFKEKYKELWGLVTDKL